MTDPGVYTGLIEFFKKYSAATSKASAGFKPKTTIGAIFSASDILGAARTFADNQAIAAETQNVGIKDRVKTAIHVQKIQSQVHGAAEEAEAHTKLLKAQLDAINDVADPRAQATLSRAVIARYKASLQGDSDDDDDE